MNLSNSIVPKSDQLNADDLISGPRTIKITAVESGSAEQPVMIQYEGGTGRPYKPSKSMRRVLVAMWGTDGNAYVGRRLTIFRDPAIKWAGEPVGGISISHASDIGEPVSLALTVTRGKRKPHTVEPLPPEEQIDVQSLKDVGDTKAREGVEPFRAWFKTLSAAAKNAMKPHLDTWKQLAEGKSAA